MEYLVTQQNLEDRISPDMVIQLADDDGDDVVDVSVIEEVCATATDLVNDMMAPRYSTYVPFTMLTCPDVLLGIAKDIAVYELFSRRNVVPEEHRFRYEQAVVRLKEYASGKLQLYFEPDVLEESEGDDVESSMSYDDRTFTHDTLSGWASSFV